MRQLRDPLPRGWAERHRFKFEYSVRGRSRFTRYHPQTDSVVNFEWNGSRGHVLLMPPRLDRFASLTMERLSRAGFEDRVIDILERAMKVTRGICYWVSDDSLLVDGAPLALCEAILSEITQALGEPEPQVLSIKTVVTSRRLSS